MNTLFVKFKLVDQLQITHFVVIKYALIMNQDKKSDLAMLRGPGFA